MGRVLEWEECLIEEAGEVTALLRAWHAGDEDAYRQVSSILYSELRRQAARRMRRAPPGTPLQTTALVHETFIRLAGAHRVDWQDRETFPGGRRPDDATGSGRSRSRTRDRRSAVHKPSTCRWTPALRQAVCCRWILIALDQALEGLAALDPRKVQVVELKFFAGLTVEETAEVLNVSPDTVARDWRMARTWLLRELSTARA